MDENITRWRLILGQDANALGEVSLNEQQSLMDATLAALYDEAAMPPALRKAHRANDKAVLAAYNLPADITESACVAELFERYRNMNKE